MLTEPRVRLLAGSLIAVSLLLGIFVAQAWLLVAAVVALNLIQSAFTGVCPAEKFPGGRQSDVRALGATSR